MYCSLNSKLKTRLSSFPPELQLKFCDELSDILNGESTQGYSESDLTKAVDDLLERQSTTQRESHSSSSAVHDNSISQPRNATNSISSPAENSAVKHREPGSDDPICESSSEAGEADQKGDPSFTDDGDHHGSYASSGDESSDMDGVTSCLSEIL